MRLGGLSHKPVKYGKAILSGMSCWSTGFLVLETHFLSELNQTPAADTAVFSRTFVTVGSQLGARIESGCLEAFLGFFFP